jgi:hypothetical protein
MLAVKNQIADFKRITQGESHFFFGYYDIRSWDSAEKYHLCHKVGFMDRMPTKNDVAEVGMVELSSGEFIKLGETTAWCFQQGAFLQWNPGAPGEEVVYNIWDGEEYRGLVRNVKTGSVRTLEKPVANLDPTGRYALSINFDRVYDYRPGYGYCARVDRFKDVERPEEDGIFLTDMHAGKSKLILSIRQIGELLDRHNSPVRDGKLLINHINFNTDGSRFVLLARSFKRSQYKHNSWVTATITANADGSDPCLLSDYMYASHYYWRDKENLLIHCRNKQAEQLYLLKDKTDEALVIDSSYFLKDGHCSYAPNREWILYDSYPDEENYRHLYLYNVKNRKGITLASLYSYPAAVNDMRCDLHPRWNPSGTGISFDSNHENHRHVYYMDLRDIISKNR